MFLICNQRKTAECLRSKWAHRNQSNADSLALWSNLIEREINIILVTSGTILAKGLVPMGLLPFFDTFQKYVYTLIHFKHMFIRINDKMESIHTGSKGFDCHSFNK